MVNKGNALKPVKTLKSNFTRYISTALSIALSISLSISIGLSIILTGAPVSAQNTKSTTPKVAISQNTLPSKVDLRETGRVTPVKDQGSANLCWAYATVAALEYNDINNKVTEMDLANNNNLIPSNAINNTGGFVTMAISHLIDKELTNNVATTTTNNAETYPEYVPVALGNTKVPTPSWVSKDYNTNKPSVPNITTINTKVPTPSWLNKPIVVQEPIVKQAEEAKPPTAEVVTNKPLGYRNIEYLDNNHKAIVKELVNNNVVYAPIAMPIRGKLSVKHGYNSSKDQQVPNHAVLIVGYDDNYSKDNFDVKPSKNGAFIAKNSWGANWGDEGYFYISYEEPSLYADTLAVFKPEVQDWDNVQKHEVSGSNGKYSNKSKNALTAANLFTSNANQQITDIGYYVGSAGKQHIITVITGFNDIKEVNIAKLDKLTTTKVEHTPKSEGHTSVKLQNPLNLKNGDKYLIVVETPTHTIEADRTLTMLDGSTYKSNIGLKNGQSYTLSNGTWNDLNSSNARLTYKSYGKYTD